MHKCTVIKENVQSHKTKRNKYVFKQNLNDDSDEERLTSFGIELQTRSTKCL